MMPIMHSIPNREMELLRLFLRNSRTDIGQLAHTLGRNRNWVARTVRRLAAEGIIRAYLTVINPSTVYVERSTILLIKTNPRELQVSKALLGMSELESMDGVAGEHSLLALFRFRGAGEFESFLDRVDRVMAKTGAQNYDLIQVLTTYKTHGFILPKHKTEGLTVSEKDWGLIRVIARQRASDSAPLPMTQREIGIRMHPPLSQPAVSKAMKRLEKRGVIIGYSADVDFAAIRLPIKFFLQIKPRPGRIARTAEYISRMEEVWDLHRVGEDFNLFATVRTNGVAAYNLFLRKLYECHDVLDTRSRISLEEWQL